MIYARVQDGMVAELFPPPPGSVISQCFHPSLVWVDVTTVSPVPQYGWSATQLSSGAWTFSPPPAAPEPTVEQLANAALLAGVQITSTASPALNGTYACDPSAQAKIMATALYCQINGKFYGDGTTYPWLDMSGAPHTFPNVAEFLAFASAVAAYVAGIDVILATGSGALPAQPVAI